MASASFGVTFFLPDLDVALLRLAAGILLPAQVVLVPGHLALAHPQRTHLNGMLRPLVLVASLLVLGAAHEVGAARHRHHVEGDVAVGNLLGVALLGDLLDLRQLGGLLGNGRRRRPEDDPGQQQQGDEPQRMTGEVLHQRGTPGRERVNRIIYTGRVATTSRRPRSGRARASGRSSTTRPARSSSRRTRGSRNVR